MSRTLAWQPPDNPELWAYTEIQKAFHPQGPHVTLATILAPDLSWIDVASVDAGGFYYRTRPWQRNGIKGEWTDPTVFSPPVSVGSILGRRDAILSFFLWLATVMPPNSGGLGPINFYYNMPAFSPPQFPAIDVMDFGAPMARPRSFGDVFESPYSGQWDTMLVSIRCWVNLASVENPTHNTDWYALTLCQQVEHLLRNAGTQREGGGIIVPPITLYSYYSPSYPTDTGQYLRPDLREGGIYTRLVVDAANPQIRHYWILARIEFPALRAS